MKKLLLLFIISFIPAVVLADAFVPDFNSMKYLRCDFVETVYNQNGDKVSSSNLYRNYRLDKTNKKIYLEKEPIDRILIYEDDKIEFILQSMSDDMISIARTTINLNTLEYSSCASLTYDNFEFGTANVKAVGMCRFID